MRQILVLAACLLATPVLSQDTTNGRVYEVMEDFVERATEFSKTSYAYVMRGSLTQFRLPEEQRQVSSCLVGVRVNVDNYLMAKGTMKTTPQGHRWERWRTKLLEHGKLHVKNGDRNTVALSDLSPDQRREFARLHMMGFLPAFDIAIDSPIRFATGTDRTAKDSEKDILSFVLVSAKYEKNGDICSEWAERYEGKNLYLQSVVRFGKDQGFNPIFRKLCYVDASVERETVPSGQIATTWAKDDNENWLPSTIELREQRHLHERRLYEIQWKYGDEITAELINSDAADWLEPSRVLFDETWLSAGDELGPIEFLRRPIPGVKP